MNIYIFHKLTKIESKRSTVEPQNLHTWSKNDQNPQNWSKLFTVKGINIYIFHQWRKVAEKFVKTMHSKCTKLTHKLYVSNFVFQELKSSKTYRKWSKTDYPKMMSRSKSNIQGKSYSHWKFCAYYSVSNIRKYTLFWFCAFYSEVRK